MNTDIAQQMLKTEKAITNEMRLLFNEGCLRQLFSRA